MSCPKCNGKLYLEEDERYSGDEGYVVMCYDCNWIDKYLYSVSTQGYDRLEELATLSDREHLANKRSE